LAASDDAGHADRSWWPPKADLQRLPGDLVVGRTELIEGTDHLEPGGSATVRLYPVWPELWARVEIDDSIEMRDGARVAGEAMIVGRVSPWSSPGQQPATG
jgi:hypothetical protein